MSSASDIRSRPVAAVARMTTDASAAVLSRTALRSSWNRREKVDRRRFVISIMII
jgi:hypothetical protein